MSKLNEQLILRCLENIKQALKKKGITYTQVAAMLDTSEITIKRSLNNPSIGLARLLQLSEIAGVALSSLLAQSETSPQKHHYFTPAQDKAFADAPHLQSYFVELFFYQKSPQQIAEENQLSPVSTYRYLTSLENIGLIKLFSENRFRFLVKPPLGFPADSLYIKKQINRFIQLTCEKVLSPERDKQHFLMVKPFTIPQPLYEKMVEELKVVVDRYAEVAELAYNENSHLPAYQLTLVGHPLNKEEFEEPPIINLDKSI
ncbi:MAG: helix-turn-helix domain-containing protein [Kangiellaceae bacterium]|nr:helix-turn-helix domain-containing protein [Kangiellaceae bacterium]